MIHIHDWETVQRKHTPALIGLTKVRSYSSEDSKIILYGITTVRQRCKKCGKENAFSVAGDAT